MLREPAFDIVLSFVFHCGFTFASYTSRVLMALSCIEGRCKRRRKGYDA